MEKPRRLRVERRPAEELTDSQIETLMAFGRREAELIEEMEAAVKVGDRNLVWQIARAIAQVKEPEV